MFFTACLTPRRALSQINMLYNYFYAAGLVVAGHLVNMKVFGSLMI